MNLSEVTIIIPHIFLSEETDFALKECLKSLEETVPEMKKIVVINGMRFENDFEIVKYPNVEFIVLERQGQCSAVNSAFSVVNTPWGFVTNNDMIYAPNWLEKLLETAKKYKLKYLCPNLVEPRPGAPPFLVQSFGGAGGDFNKEAWLDFASKHEEKMLEEGFNLPFLIDREVWQRIGGYDINYDPWGSNGDSDLQAKLILGSLTTFRDRNVVVYHFSQTSGTFHPDNQSYWQKNYAYFQEKWGFERQPESEKVWYSKDIIDHVKLIYHPEWEKKLSKASFADFNFVGNPK